MSQSAILDAAVPTEGIADRRRPGRKGHRANPGRRPAGPGGGS